MRVVRAACPDSLPVKASGSLRLNFLAGRFFLEPFVEVEDFEFDFC